MADSPKVVVLTGAGISVESGLPSYRSGDGLWAEFKLEEVATPEAFASDPERVHRFYNQRRSQLRLSGVQPNAAHLALSELKRALGDRMWLVTQNVDDLHERSGVSNLLHMHGEILKSRCNDCGSIRRVESDMSVADRCSNCGKSGVLRPHIVWFGEEPFGMEEIWKAVSGCDVFVAIGTSGVVEPAASLASQARMVGADTYCMTTEPPANLGSFQTYLRGRATETVPAWVEDMKGRFA